VTADRDPAPKPGLRRRLAGLSPFHRLRRSGLYRRLTGDRRGNVMLLFGLALIPLVFATGMGIDYGKAMRLQTQMEAAADAAALAAVSQQALNWTPATAKTTARNFFISQTTGLSGMTIDYNDTSQFNVVVNDTNGAINVRTATVTFRAQSANSFAGILGMDTLTIKGTSASTASTAPNIDFYVLMDMSGSMALPTTTAGLSTMTTKTGGCAFACHSTNDLKAATQNVAPWNGAQADYYTVAQSYGIPLRVNAETTAVSQLMTVAQSVATANNVTYRMSISRFSRVNRFVNVQTLTNNLPTAGTTAAAQTIDAYYSNNNPTSTLNNNDTDTATSDAFTHMLTVMPVTPGNGSNHTGDTPQAMMFIITDGMRDESRPGGDPEAGIDTSYCNTVKARGIRIAILYTEYLPETASDSWSQQHALPHIPEIEPALQSCASTGLYYKVTTNSDISAALNGLFQQAVASAHLTQ
jgi:Flp pilus assembly protein TadG